MVRYEFRCSVCSALVEHGTREPQAHCPEAVMKRVYRSVNVNRRYINQ